MTLYVLGYDLCKDRNYQPLYNELKEFNEKIVLKFGDVSKDSTQMPMD